MTVGELERRLVEQFESHERTAGAVLPDDADRETVALQTSEARYIAVKEALVEIARAIDQLSDARLVDSERVAELGLLVTAAEPGKRSKKKQKTKKKTSS